MNTNKSGNLGIYSVQYYSMRPVLLYNNPWHNLFRFRNVWKELDERGVGLALWIRCGISTSPLEVTIHAMP